MNWEAIVIAAIPGLLALLGFIYNEYRKRKNASDEAKDARESNREARREPTWNDVVTENRKLREELTATNKRFDEFVAEFQEYKTRTSRKIDAFVETLADAARQWPENHDGPVFDPDIFDTLEDTEIPVRWKGRIRVIPGLA